MSVLKKVYVANIRSHVEYLLELSPQVTIITGANGSGKTSLLEAIYVSLQGSSFKGSDGDMLRRDSPWWRIDVAFTDEESRIVKFEPSKTTGRKQFVVDNKTTSRLPAKQKLPVVLFEPEDLRLLHGSPSRRRQFIDKFITQINPLYGTTLRKYERALKQRNNLLKQSYIRDDELFAWNVALAESGAYIIEQRMIFIQKLNNNLSTLYQEISGTSDVVAVSYSHEYQYDIKQSLMNDLHNNAQRDQYLGNTSVGPHRHDVIFSINHSPAISVASRGEARTIVLAIKFLEVEFIESLLQKKPIILLDDVFSELDESRQNLLTMQLTEYQIIITSATSHAANELLHVRL